MTKNLSFAAFSLGLGIVLWISSGFLGTSLLALLVCAAILLVYGIGFIELIRYQKATTGLQQQLQALSQPPENLDTWLQNLPSNLQHGVRKRLAGESQGLPQPVLSSFLVGLLVMLGLLGTFIGMVETLKGAVIALETSNELEAIRQGLAQPMHGLSMAFGTSIAGVSASAMLGFIASLSKRQRVQASRLLDAQISNILQPFSLNFQRQQTFNALQQQANSLPEAAQSLSATSLQLQQFSQNMAQLLETQQTQFAQSQQQQMQKLTEQIQQGINQHLSQSGELIASAIKPQIAELLENVKTQSSAQLHALEQQSQNQLESFNKQSLEHSKQLQGHIQTQSEQNAAQQQALLQQLEQHIQQNLAKLSEHQNHNAQQQLQQSENLQQQLQAHNAKLSEDFAKQINAQQTEQNQKLTQSLSQVTQLLSTTENLVQTRIETEQAAQRQVDARFSELNKNLSQQLEAINQQQQQGYQQNVAALEQLQTNAAQNLQQLGQALEAPMANLIATASEAPKAAAEVIEQLRGEISKNLARDNELLTERQKIMAELNQLSTDMAASAQSQRQAIEKITGSAEKTLEQVAQNFSQQVNQDAQQLTEAMAQFKDSALALQALGQAFEQGVGSFGQSNNTLAEQLQAIGQNLSQASERSDEQMAYYVAQAREIIDHNVSAQQSIIEQLQQLPKGA